MQALRDTEVLEKAIKKDKSQNYQTISDTKEK